MSGALTALNGSSCIITPFGASREVGSHGSHLHFSSSRTIVNVQRAEHRKGFGLPDFKISKMIFSPRLMRTGFQLFLMALAIFALPPAGRALPARLVLALDGIAYRDMQALQTGVTRTNFWGKTYQLRAFTVQEGYFPVSRMISTFPSASDVAWTDIFGDRPLPGYQRTYYSAEANSLIELNGVTTTMEHERQMDWQVQNGFVRALGYLFPAHTLRYEMHGMVVNFLKTAGLKENYYVYIRASDDSQHLDRDILALLCELDHRLQKLRSEYKAREGRDLEIVILSDHGHNHAGRGTRVQDAAFLERAGYHVGTAITGPKDVVLPVVGIESWVEVHCDLGESEKLAKLLCQLEGVDVLAAIVPYRANHFLVMNSKGERADILWKPERNMFRYVPVNGDPILYRPVVKELEQNQRLDGEGFATADDWMAATMANHYPLALERIARGLTRGALNPATILISLDNHYVNDYWLTEKGSRLVTCRSTHGGLDDICSDGILLSNFQPTHDTSTARVAGQFKNFPGVKDYRAEEAGAELVTKKEQAFTRIHRDPFDRESQQLLGDGVYLRIWSPLLAELDGKTPIAVAIGKVPRYSTSPNPQQFVLNEPLALADSNTSERVYALPADLNLKPQSEYNISGLLKGQPKDNPLFEFSFHTTENGQPAAF